MNWQWEDDFASESPQMYLWHCLTIFLIAACENEDVKPISISTQQSWDKDLNVLLVGLYSILKHSGIS